MTWKRAAAEAEPSSSNMQEQRIAKFEEIGKPLSNHSILPGQELTNPFISFRA